MGEDQGEVRAVGIEGWALGTEVWALGTVEEEVEVSPH
jgi:hypothetical protein